MGFVTGAAIGEWLIFFLDNCTEDGWSIWTDPISGKTRVWDSIGPTLLDNGLLSDDWSKSFDSQSEAWRYINELK